MKAFSSSIPGIIWPPIPNTGRQLLPALLDQLEKTQWLPYAEIHQYQHQQLRMLAKHAAQFSPNFSQRLQTAGLNPDDLTTLEGLQSLPILSRLAIQSSGEDLFCSQIPAMHGPIKSSQTSGSCGQTVIVKRTAVNQLFWLAFTMREHFWHQRNFKEKLAIIRAGLPAPEIDAPNWGAPVSLLFESGTAHGLKINTNIADQIKWINKLNPGYLLTYPNNLAALLQYYEQPNVFLPRLLQIRTISETLTTEIREKTRKIFNIEIADTYSSQEVGIIAAQCPVSGLYHIMSESLIVEVLDEHGRPCMPGQIGQVVVTDLHNFSTPLVRYSIGDYAEVAAPCICGRGLPTLKNIVGRQRNMVMLPNGNRHWPLVGFQHYREIAPIRQYQLIQHTLHDIEVKLVVDHSLSASQERELTLAICNALNYPFQLKFTYFADEIPRNPGGKFEEFICKVESIEKNLR